MAKKKATIDEVKHIARLANLPLNEKQIKTLGEELSETIEFIDHLSEINTDNVLPTSQVTGKTNELRQDKITPGLSQKEALKNAKRTHNGYFVSKIEWS